MTDPGAPANTFVDDVVRTVADPGPPPPPGYCSAADVEAALGRPLPTDRDVTTLIGSASDLIDGYLKISVAQLTSTDATTGITTNIGYPPMVIRVCAEMVANVLNRPYPKVPSDMPDPYNAPAFQFQIGPATVGPWLSETQKLRLNRLRRHLRSVEMYSETTGYFVRYGIADLSTSMEFDMFDMAGTDDELFNQQLGP